MKIADLRSKSQEDLALLLVEKRRRVNELRSLLSRRKVKNVKEMRGIRKDIARILTFIRQRTPQNSTRSAEK